jgi:hypothetical protein
MFFKTAATIEALRKTHNEHISGTVKNKSEVTAARNWIK